MTKLNFFMMKLSLFCFFVQFLLNDSSHLLNNLSLLLFFMNHCENYRFLSTSSFVHIFSTISLVSLTFRSQLTSWNNFFLILIDLEKNSFILSVFTNQNNESRLDSIKITCSLDRKKSFWKLLFFCFLFDSEMLIIFFYTFSGIK